METPRPRLQEDGSSEKPRPTAVVFKEEVPRVVRPEIGYTRWVRGILATGTFLERRSSVTVLFLGLLTMAAIGEIDVLTGPKVSFSIFYLIPICFVTWRLGRKVGIALCFLGATIWMAADIFSGNSYDSSTLPIWNAGVRLGFFLIVTQTLASLSTMVEWVRTDYLTGLANRRGFYEIAEDEIYRSRRSGAAFTFVYVDIDDFKSINDTHGHDAGDNLLRLAGSTLRKITRRSDVVARLGGDEFAIMLTDTSFESSRSAIQKLRENLSQVFHQGNWPVTFSMGAATFRSWPGSIESAIREADALMYEAKKCGKDMLIHRLIHRI